MGVTDAEEEEADERIKGIDINVDRGCNEYTKCHSDINHRRSGTCHKHGNERNQTKDPSSVSPDGKGGRRFQTRDKVRKKAGSQVCIVGKHQYKGEDCGAEQGGV